MTTAQFRKEARADITDMITEAAQAALRAVRPGDQSFIAFTVFINQLQIVLLEKNEADHD